MAGSTVLKVLFNDDLVDENRVFIFGGGEQHYTEEFNEMKKRFPNKAANDLGLADVPEELSNQLLEGKVYQFKDGGLKTSFVDEFMAHMDHLNLGFQESDISKHNLHENETPQSGSWMVDIQTNDARGNLFVNIPGEDYNNIREECIQKFNEELENYYKGKGLQSSSDEESIENDRRGKGPGDIRLIDILLENFREKVSFIHYAFSNGDVETRNFYK